MAIKVLATVLNTLSSVIAFIILMGLCDVEDTDAIPENRNTIAAFIIFAILFTNLFSIFSLWCN